MKLPQALIDKYWKEAQQSPQGKMIKKMKLTKEDWMRFKDYEVEEPDEME